jgi:transcription antitermination factor NusG
VGHLEDVAVLVFLPHPMPAPRNNAWRQDLRSLLAHHIGEPMRAGALFEQCGADVMPLFQATRPWVQRGRDLASAPHDVMRFFSFSRALRRMPVTFDPPLSRASPMREDTLVICVASTAGERKHNGRAKTLGETPPLKFEPRPEPRAAIIHSEPSPYFAVARVQSQREAFAAGHLESRGYEVFLPRIETRRAVQPLFLGYLFVRVADGRWRAIETTFGVIALVRTGDCPCRCPDREIEALRARMGPKGVIALPPAPAPRKFAKGESVKVNVGGSLLAGVHSGYSLRDRERVLLRVLGATRAIMAPRYHVYPAAG